MQHARQRAGAEGPAALFMPPSASLHTVLLHRPAAPGSEVGAMAALRASAQTCDPLLVLVPAAAPPAIQTAQRCSACAIPPHCVGREAARWGSKHGRPGTSTAIIGINKADAGPTAERGHGQGSQSRRIKYECGGE